MVKKIKFRFDRKKISNTRNHRIPYDRIPDRTEHLERGKSYIGRVSAYGRRGDPIVRNGYNNPVVIINRGCKGQMPAIGEIVAYEVTYLSCLVVFARLIER
ncbi:MAG TPA: hypothetical protein VJ343_02185 [archaeon]|nr:hypothetical protein [archaeon]